MTINFTLQRMGSSLKRNLQQKIHDYIAKGFFSEKVGRILEGFYSDYVQAALSQGYSHSKIEALLEQFLKLVLEQLKNPYEFGLFHKRITEPFDYYQFGLEMIRPLVIKEQSRVLGLPALDQIRSRVAQGDNVILFSNHQTEPDPQIINLLLEDSYKEFASEMIFVAGDRVVTDPLAAPLSIGCNLLCIYSKKHIDNPPEQKEEKLLHNQRTMKKMLELLSIGGNCIYVAPSGGRDRLNERGQPTVASFDPNNIEMFSLFAKKAKKKTTFFTLSLYTYPILPPPEKVEEEIGEMRKASASPAHLYFGEEIDFMDEKSGRTKEEKRKIRAETIWNQVRTNYEKLF